MLVCQFSTDFNRLLPSFALAYEKKSVMFALAYTLRESTKIIQDEKAERLFAVKLGLLW
jgi:hypothetical protein